MWLERKGLCCFAVALFLRCVEGNDGRSCLSGIIELDSTLDGEVVLVDVLKVFLHVEHIIDNVAVDGALEERLRVTYHVVTSLDAFAVSKVGKLLDKVLMAEVADKVFGCFVFAEFGAVLVGVVEAELDDEPACGTLRVVGSEEGGVLSNEVVGHDASPSIDDTAEGSLILLTSLLDGVFIEEFSSVVAGDEVHVVVFGVSLFIGLLDATSRRCVITGDGQVDAITRGSMDSLMKA